LVVARSSGPHPSAGQGGCASELVMRMKPVLFVTNDAERTLLMSSVTMPLAI
jgi:hypothetical protein